jgi:flagellar motor protein MotB
MENLQQHNTLQPSTRPPFVEVENAASNVGSVDGYQDAAFNFPSGNESGYMMDPAHSQHFLAPPSPSVPSPHHAPFSPQSLVSPIAVGSPGSQFPPESPQDFFSPGPSPVHSVHSQHDIPLYPWDSRQSSPSVRGNVLDGNDNNNGGPSTGNGLNQTILPNELDFDLSFPSSGHSSALYGTQQQQQMTEPLPSATTEYAGLGTGSSETSAFPSSGGEGQFFSGSQASSSQHQQQQFSTVTSLMPGFNPNAYSMGSSQGNGNADTSILPLTAAHLEARFPTESGNQLGMSERANSGIGNADWELLMKDPQLQSSQMNFNFIPNEMAVTNLPSGAHTPAPLMDTFSADAFNAANIQTGFDMSMMQLGQQQAYGQTAPPSPLPNTLPWDQSSGQLPGGDIQQFQAQLQQQQQQLQQQFQTQLQQQQQQQQQQSQPMQTQFQHLHQQHAQSQHPGGFQRHPTRRRSQSASDAFPTNPHPHAASSYNQQNILGQEVLTAQPIPGKFTGDIYLGGQGGANLRATKSCNAPGHRKAVSNYDVIPIITFTGVGQTAAQSNSGFQPYSQFSDGSQPPKSMTGAQSNLAMNFGNGNSFNASTSTAFQSQPYSQQQQPQHIQPPPLPHGMSYPGPVPVPSLPSHHHYHDHHHHHENTSFPPAVSMKTKQQGQRAEINEKMLHGAFTPASAHPDKGLRAMLEIIRGCPFYLDETIEPVQGSELAEQIFAQVRLVVPNDPRFAPHANRDSHAGTSSAHGEQSGGAQSIYMLFTENNVCLICGKKTDRSTRALGHVRSDIGHRPFHCDCEKCTISPK